MNQGRKFRDMLVSEKELKSGLNKLLVNRDNRKWTIYATSLLLTTCSFLLTENAIPACPLNPLLHA